MRSQEKIESLYKWELKHLEQMEEFLCNSYTYERQGRILQEEVRQAEMRYNAVLAVVHTLEWVLQINEKSPF